MINKKQQNLSAKMSKACGFTIVELMISTVVFSLVLLMCLAGIVQVSRAYYKGISHSRTQEAGRLVMEEISRTIQLSGSPVVSNPPAEEYHGPEIPALDEEGNQVSYDLEEATGSFCAGNKLYSYVIDRKVAEDDIEGKQIQHAMVSQDALCSDGIASEVNLSADLESTVLDSGKRSLLNEDMRLTKFVVEPVDGNVARTKNGSQLWRVEVSIAYGDSDLLRYEDDRGNNRVTCRPGTGNEFCAIVELSTIVSRRIG